MYLVLLTFNSINQQQCNGLNTFEAEVLPVYTALLQVGESNKWSAGIGIYTHVQQQLRMLLYFFVLRGVCVRGS